MKSEAQRYSVNFPKGHTVAMRDIIKLAFWQILQSPCSIASICKDICGKDGSIQTLNVELGSVRYNGLLSFFQSQLGVLKERFYSDNFWTQANYRTNRCVVHLKLIQWCMSIYLNFLKATCINICIGI